MNSIQIERDIKNGLEISVLCGNTEEAHKIVDWCIKKINNKDISLSDYLIDGSSFNYKEECIVIDSDGWGICDKGYYNDINYSDIQFQVMSLEDYTIEELLDEIKYRFKSLK